MNIDIRFVLAALRKAYGEAKAANPVVALRDQLQAKSDAQFDVVAAGGIKSVHANNQNVTFDISGAAPGTPMEVLAVWVYLVEQFDRAKAALGGAPTDAQIEAQMETYLRPVYGYTDNWMYIAK